MGQRHVDRWWWQPCGGATKRSRTSTPFPAQIPVRRIGPSSPPPLPEAAFSSVMTYVKGHNFELTLNSTQTERLVTMMLEAERRLAGGSEQHEGAGGASESKESSPAKRRRRRMADERTSPPTVEV